MKEDTLFISLRAFAAPKLPQRDGQLPYNMLASGWQEGCEEHAKTLHASNEVLSVPRSVAAPDSAGADSQFQRSFAERARATERYEAAVARLEEASQKELFQLNLWCSTISNDDYFQLVKDNRPRKAPSHREPPASVFSFRPTISSDLPQLEGLLFPGQLRSDEGPKKFRQFAYASDVLVVAATAESEGILGFCAATAADRALHFTGVWMRPEARRNGVASVLVSAVCDSFSPSSISASAYSPDERDFWKCFMETEQITMETPGVLGVFTTDCLGVRRLF